ncbi:hypothetical protein MUY14_38650 [Amycolatopsis sp. FBCC-B4732]|uniref:hypothetical protein n=1 Tax=unclassified Amycolatopsis TaxID=2618356 RepID=UPI001FF117CC|nr:hypothetical protein [Amycolatopsis sp. FBCC-B4732]UOX87585.1 hypothetical protein MUY14_38650 [Amycolatopsis sp. FBCC-B4732]
MLANLLGHLEWVTVAVVVTLSTVTRAWLRLRRTEVRQRFETDRLHKALEGSSPTERPEIIRALAAVPAPAEDSDEPEPQEHTLLDWLRRHRPLAPPKE